LKLDANASSLHIFCFISLFAQNGRPISLQLLLFIHGEYILHFCFDFKELNARNSRQGIDFSVVRSTSQVDNDNGEANEDKMAYNFLT